MGKQLRGMSSVGKSSLFSARKMLKAAWDQQKTLTGKRNISQQKITSTSTTSYFNKDSTHEELMLLVRLTCDPEFSEFAASQLAQQLSGYITTKLKRSDFLPLIKHQLLVRVN